MKCHTILTGIAALFLATGAAHADDRKWESSFRRCQVWKNFGASQYWGSSEEPRQAAPGAFYLGKLSCDDQRGLVLCRDDRPRRSFANRALKDDAQLEHDAQRGRWHLSPRHHKN
jgi:hypothetical protein